MKSDPFPLESLIQHARRASGPGMETSAPFGFSTRVAALGLAARKEKTRNALAWRLAWVSLFPALACACFLLLSQGSLQELWSGDSALLGIGEELLLP